MKHHDGIVDSPFFGLKWATPSGTAFSMYAGHDTRTGVKVSNGPVRRNQTAEDKLASARVRAKEVGGETRRTRTESGYKAFSRASQHWMAKPQP